MEILIFTGKYFSIKSKWFYIKCLLEFFVFFSVKQFYLEQYDTYHQVYGMYKQYHYTPSPIPL